MSYIILLGLFAISSFVYYMWIHKKHSNRDPSKKSPAVAPGYVPLIGHVFKLFGDNTKLWNYIKEMNEFCNAHDGFVEGYLGPVTFYGVTDPDASLEIANKCLDKPYIYNFVNCIFFNGLFTAEANIWKLHRKLLNPLFNSQKINAFMEIFNERSQDLVSTLSTEVGKHAFDVMPYLIKNSLAVSSQTTLGLSPKNDSIAGDIYGHCMNELTASFVERFNNPLLHLPFIFNFSALKRKQDALKKITSDIVNVELQKRKIMMKKESDVGTPDKLKHLLDTVINLKEEGVFSDEEVLGQLNSILFGSFDSTASGLLIILLLLGTHQDVQERVYDEVQDILGDRDATQNDLVKMVYLEAVVKECLRLYPVAPVIARNIDTDINIKDYLLKAGNVCLISLYGINRLPIWGRDADKFRPERWLEPDSLPANPNAFATFSFGKRNCIGRHYGMMSMKTSLTHIMRRYRIHGDINKLVLKYELFLKPVSGHEISLELRQ